MDVRLLITPPLPIKTENDASSVIREDDPRDGLMVPLRARVHARPAHLVDEVPFCDLSKEGITPEHTCDFHAEDWRGVSCCMFASYMLPQNTVVCFFAESSLQRSDSQTCHARSLGYAYQYEEDSVHTRITPSNAPGVVESHRTPEWHDETSTVLRV